MFPVAYSSTLNSEAAYIEMNFDAENFIMNTSNAYFVSSY